MSYNIRILTFGALPYDSIEGLERMNQKLFMKRTGLFLLPNISSKDNIYDISLSNFPWIKKNGNEYNIKTQIEAYEPAKEKLDACFDNSENENIEQFGFTTVYLEKFLKMVNSDKPSSVCFELLGPFSTSLLLVNKNKGEDNLTFITQKQYRNLFGKMLCVKALWLINKIKSANRTTRPIVIINEPFLNKIGDIKRNDINYSSEVITSMYSAIVSRLQDAGAIVVIHSDSKCNWQPILQSGVNIISYDAYKNPDNISVFPNDLNEFIQKGGMINYAIVPTISETIIKNLTLDLLEKRFNNIVDRLSSVGVPKQSIYKSASVSLQGAIDKLPLFFAEKTLILTKQFSEKLEKLF